MAKQSEYSKQNILNIEDMEQDLIEVFTLYYGEQMREHIESVFNQTLFVFGDEHTPQHIEDSVKFLESLGLREKLVADKEIPFDLVKDVSSQTSFQYVCFIKNDSGEIEPVFLIKYADAISPDTLIHEIVHAIDSYFLTRKDGGIEFSTGVKPTFCCLKKQFGDYRYIDYNFDEVEFFSLIVLNEAITEYKTKKLIDIMKEKGLSFGEDKENKYAYYTKTGQVLEPLFDIIEPIIKDASEGSCGQSIKSILAKEITVTKIGERETDNFFSDEVETFEYYEKASLWSHLCDLAGDILLCKNDEDCEALLAKPENKKIIEEVKIAFLERGL